MKTTDHAPLTKSSDHKLVRLESAGLGRLIDMLLADGYEVLGPVVRDNAIVIEPITSTEDLPTGIGDDQAGGRYRLTKRDDYSRFGYAVGPHSWKKYLFPPHRMLWRASADERGFSVDVPQSDGRRRAFIAVRGCEVAAMHIQDRVFSGGAFPDPDYANRRANTFVVAVECGSPAQTCFCTSMGTGPGVTYGFDIRLTELLDGDQPYYLACGGSEQGAAILDKIPSVVASDAHLEERDVTLTAARAQISRHIDADDARRLVLENPEHPRWDVVASRCLTCGNCTQVCPTCFCSTVEDVTDLATGDVERSRRWDSCFTVAHSHVHGGAVRRSPRSRFRQWMTHKLGSWQEQFGTPGCSGCGRCITWCPVGIDITEEVGHLSSVQSATVEDEA